MSCSREAGTAWLGAGPCDGCHSGLGLPVGRGPQMEATSGGTATGRSAVLVGGTTHAEAGADWTLAASARDSGTWWPAPWQAECTCRCSTLRVSKQFSQTCGLRQSSLAPRTTFHMQRAQLSCCIELEVHCRPVPSTDHVPSSAGRRKLLSIAQYLVGRQRNRGMRAWQSSGQR